MWSGEAGRLHQDESETEMLIEDKSPKFQEPDCLCVTCNRDIHHLGIMSHRAMHRRRRENCEIIFSTGKRVSYNFEAKR